MSAVLTFVK